MKKFMVYFINSSNERDGTTIIDANTAEEAKEIYRRFFNFKDKCHAIPTIQATRNRSK